jgi:hypothetical protein
MPEHGFKMKLSIVAVGEILDSRCVMWLLELKK